MSEKAKNIALKAKLDAQKKRETVRREMTEKEKESIQTIMKLVEETKEQNQYAMGIMNTQVKQIDSLESEIHELLKIIENLLGEKGIANELINTIEYNTKENYTYTENGEKKETENHNKGELVNSPSQHLYKYTGNCIC